MRTKAILAFAPWRGVKAIFAGAFLLTLLTSGSTASADDGSKPQWMTVSGTAVPSDCGGENYAIELSGDLEGCWTVFPEAYDCDELNGFAYYTESGRESFDGTRGGEPGEFAIKYTYQATLGQGFCSSFDFLAQLAGSCKHDVKGVSGSLKGVVGSISFFDIIPGVSTDGVILPGPQGATHYLYVGQLNR